MYTCTAGTQIMNAHNTKLEAIHNTARTRTCLHIIHSWRLDITHRLWLDHICTLTYSWRLDHVCTHIQLEARSCPHNTQPEATSSIHITHSWKLDHVCTHIHMIQLEARSYSHITHSWKLDITHSWRLDHVHTQLGV